jgi:macrodomain Ter protein organizer (MatP/YcbG family)
MHKVLTIRDDVYTRLKKVKRRLGLSFSQVIEYLLNIYDSQGARNKILSLKGSLKVSSIDAKALARVYRE